MVEIRIDGLLEALGRSFYWLAKETGVSHTTLWRLKKGHARGINFDTLEKICRALDCQTGDVMRVAFGNEGGGPRALGPAGGVRKSGAAKRVRAAKGAR